MRYSETARERQARLLAEWHYKRVMGWACRDYASPVGRACYAVKQQIARERALIWLRSFSRRALAVREQEEAKRRAKEEWEALMEFGNVLFLRRQAQ